MNDSYKYIDNKISINVRNWDMYRDEELDRKGYIKNVHCMTYNEALDITGNEAPTNGIRSTGTSYWLSTPYDATNLKMVVSYGKISATNEYPFGIRPVIELNDSVYIISGRGTETSPYILGKD